MYYNLILLFYTINLLSNTIHIFLLVIKTVFEDFLVKVISVVIGISILHSKTHVSFKISFRPRLQCNSLFRFV